jgi:pyocin large subunit-like protein
MLSRTAVSLSRRAAVPAFAASASRSVTTVAEAATADDALKFSGYQQIDFKIKDTATVYEAVQKLAAFNIGCLVTTDEAGTKQSQGAICALLAAQQLRMRVVAGPDG